MADINFYFNNSETIELLKQLYFEGCKIVPDLNYERSEYIVLNNFKECYDFIDVNSSNLLFILHPKFSLYPLILDPITKNDRIFYSIRQRYGGISLSLFFTGIFKKDNATVLGHGFLSYYPYYYDNSNNNKIFVTEDFIDLYKRIKNWISKKSISYKLHSRSYYLGNDAINQALNNKYCLRDISNETLAEIKKSFNFSSSSSQ